MKRVFMHLQYVSTKWPWQKLPYQVKKYIKVSNEAWITFSDMLSTAGGFEKIAGKRGGVEYLILNVYSPRGPVHWNVQSIGDIISFRIYDSYFHHDVRGHPAGVTLPRIMRVDLFFFFFFAIFLQMFPSFSLLSLSSYFPFYWAFISYFCLALLIH